MYFSFRGRLFAAPRVNGGPGPLRWLGNMPDLSLGLATKEEEHTESYSGQDLVDFILETGRTATLKGTMEDWSPENVIMLTRSRSTPVAGGNVTAEVLPDGLVAGDDVLFAHQLVSDVVITDSAATPATVAGSKYQVRSAGGGIKLLDVTGLTQPLKAAYVYGAALRLALLSTGAPEYWLRFEGVNKQDNSPIVMDLYRAQPKVTSDLGLIASGQGKLPFEAGILVDADKDPEGDLGQFGQLILPVAA